MFRMRPRPEEGGMQFNIRAADKLRKLYHLNRFMHIKMRDSDLSGFDAEWDNCLDRLEGTDLRLLTEN